MSVRERTSLLVVLASVAAASAGCASAPRAVPPPAPTYEEKLAGILRLEDQRILRADRAQPSPVVPAEAGRRPAMIPPPPPPSDLLGWLGDPEGRVRRRAALAVGRAGLPEGVEPLVALLRDPEPEVRQMAAFALGLLHDRSAVPALVDALADPSPLVQGRAAEGLGLIGEASSGRAVAEMIGRHITQPAVMALARGGDAPEPADATVEAVRLGLFALARLQAVEPLLSVALSPEGQPRLHWWPLAYALQRVRDPRTATALLTLARSQDRVSRGFAFNGLGALKEARGVPVLLPVAEGWRTDAGLSALAVRALGQIGDSRAVPVLVKLAATRPLDRAVQLETVTALGAIGAREAREPLYDLVGDPWPTMRAAALRALHRIDPGNFMVVLSGLDPDRHWSVRAATAEIVGAYPPELALPRLTAALKDPDRRVLPAVLGALGRAKAPGLERILVEHLADADPVVRMAAARELAALAPAGAVAALEAAYRRGRDDTTYLARAAALDALAACGARAALPALTEALADPEWAVRSRAASLVARLDPTADPWRRIRPATPARPSTAYALPGLVAPPVSPHVFVETAGGTIEIELLVLEAPLTCEAFVRLARDRFFDGLAVHRVVTGFVAQTGDPRGDGEGGVGRTLRDELSPTPYRRGTVGMALDWADTGTSQFFITVGPQPHLDGRYPAFGRVVSGMEAVDALRQWDVITRVWVWDGTGEGR